MGGHFSNLFAMGKCSEQLLFLSDLQLRAE